MTQEEIQAAAAEFKGMAEYWNLVAANTYNEWAAMKYRKNKNGYDGGHKSKKDFDDYKRMVYSRHKHFRRRANLCTAVEKMLLEEKDFEPEKSESPLANAGKIIVENFKLLKP
jgi:hypothetical protein